MLFRLKQINPWLAVAVTAAVFGGKQLMAQSSFTGSTPIADSAAVQAPTPPAEASQSSVNADTAASRSAALPAVLAGADGFGLTSDDGQFILRIRAGVQIDGRFFLADDAHALTDQIQLRRVRPDLQGTLFGNYAFRLYVDITPTAVEILDVYANIRVLPALQIRAGKMKGPVGLERLQAPYVTSFAERALPTMLVPNRDLGIQLLGVVGGRVEYAIGIFNGVPDGASADVDTGDSKDLNARLFLTPLRGLGAGPLEGLSFGAAVSRGDQNGTLASTGLAALRTGGREIFFRYRADGTTDGTAVASGTRTRISPQATWYWKNLGAMGEYVSSRANVTRGLQSAELTNTAWEITGSMVLTGEPTSYRGVVPARPLDAAAGTWGAIELTARANGLSVDEETFPFFANPVQSVQKATAYAGGINWYLNRGIRLLLNYERTTFDAAPNGVERPTESTVITRLQFVF